MKKLFLACGVALTLGLASCGNSSDSAKSFDDSLSVAYGQFNGAQLNLSYNSMPEDQKAQFNKNEIIRGFKAALLTDTTDQAYLTGLNIGMNMANQLMEMERNGVKVDRSKVLAALSKAFMADSLSPEYLQEIQPEYQRLMMEAQSRIMAAQQEQQAAAREAAEAEAAANSEAAAKFFEELHKDPAVKFTESGLAYKVDKEGTGAKPAADSKVMLTYKGTLIDGTVFDETKEPIEMMPQQTVPGFSEGLQLMPAGSTYTLYIPANLGYGDRPAGKIPANSTLIFTITIDSVK